MPSDPAAAQEPSSDAGLGDLYLHGHPFTQTFDPARTEYAATVGQNQTRVFVRARANHSEATATIADERSTPSGWLIVSLDPRPSCIAVVVTAEDGTTTRTYSIGIDGQVPGPACTTPEPPPNQLSITPTKPWRFQWDTDDLSYTVGGLVDGDLAEEVVTGALSRESGNAVGNYAINMGTLAVTDAYTRKYGLPNAPTVETYTIKPNPRHLAIQSKNIWKRLGEPDALSYEILGLIDGDLAEDVVTGALSREPGEDVGAYAISLGTLSIAESYARKYTLPSIPIDNTYWITDLPAANVNEDEVGAAPGSIMFADQRDYWDLDEDDIALEDTLTVAPGMTVLYYVAPITSPTADVMIEVKTDPPSNWIWGEESSATVTSERNWPYTLRSPFTFDRNGPPGLTGGERVSITPGPDASGTVTITHIGLSADPKYNGRLGTLTINVAPLQPGQCSSLAAPTVTHRSGRTVGITAGPAHCDSQDDAGNRAVITGYETEFSVDGGPWSTLHDYDRPQWYDGSKWFKSEKTYRPTMLEFTGDLGVTYRVRSRGIASYHDPNKAVAEWEQTTTSWSPPTEFTVSDQSSDSAGDTDYDTDGDGLIEVSNLTQLNAIRWDADGSGTPDLLAFKAAYAAAFPDAAAGMGCYVADCIGYELTADLDFDTNGSGQADVGDAYWGGGGGWSPLGLLNEFAAVFDGNGHVIRNLYINTGNRNAGLFARVADTGAIRNLGLESISVTSNKEYAGNVGGLVGSNQGTIKNSYVTGTVTAGDYVGGLVGVAGSSSVIIDSYSTASVTGTRDSPHDGAVGGLVGGNVGKILGSYATGRVHGKANLVGGLVGWHTYAPNLYREGLIKASYATGDVSGEGRAIGGLVGMSEGDIEASYATGATTATIPAGGLDTTEAGRMRLAYGSAYVGGLVGQRGGGLLPRSITTESYWDIDSSGLNASAGGTGKSADELVTPTGYVGIYADWNVDLDGDGRADDPWNFGTDSQYPVLKRAGPGVAEQRAQLPTLPTLEPATYSVSTAATAVEGENAALTITLGEAAPTGGVAFTVTASYPASGATADDLGAITSPVNVREGLSSLEIAVPTVEDTYDEDDEAFTVTVATVSSDWTPAGVGQDTATVTIKDDDTAGMSVNAASPLAVAEGGSATYTVVLDSQPTEDVTVSASSNDAGAATVAPASHTFTPSGWNTPLTFTVSGVADDDTNDETVDISHSVTSADAKYGAVLLATVSVVVSDTTGSGQQQQEQTPQEKYADLVTQMYEWRNDPQWSGYKAHTDRWDRALLAFGEEVSDTTLTPMTAAEAQAFADRGWSRWVDVAKALREIEAAANQAPTVSAALGDVTIVNQSGTKQVSLSGVFSDADDDTLTIIAVSSDDAKATASVASDYSTLTVTAKARGAATITVTADDGNGGSVSDSFTVTVKAPPVVASALADISGLEEAATQDVSLSGVFSDADDDTLTVTATSSDEDKATVSVDSDGSKLTLTGVAEGTATITVTAQDSDGNRVSDDFEVPVARKYAALIAQMYQWRNDPQWSGYKAHTDRWDRALLAFGETVADTTLTTMTAAEAQAFADRGWSRWVDVAAALREIEAAGQQQQPAPNRAPTVTSGIGDATIINESGTHQESLSRVFSDADSDSLTITASSSDETKATVSVAPDYSSLTVTAKARGAATITVTADDGNGGTVQDTFTVAVKAAPTVASALADVSGLEETAMQDVSLSGVFSDTDGDTLTITAASSDETKATVSAASDGSTLTLTGVAEGTATITVTAQDSDGNRVSDTFEVSVAKAPQLQQTNRAPTVTSAIGDATIVNESGTHQTSLSSVFSDPDNDSLTITASSSNEAVATVSVVPDYSSLTVTAKVRGTATITVTADDGNGATVSDSFTVTVKAAPVVASALADVNGMTVGASKDVSLAGVFSDGDGDTLTITTASSDYDVANAFAFHGTLTVAAFSTGSATITVTAQDSDGNPVSDQFAVTVAAPQQQDPPPNQAPTVASAIADTTIVNQSGTKQVSLSGVFSDGDGDSLTITAASSDETKATASVALDGSNLTVNAQARGTATITVTADDGNGATVQDTFTVTVKAAPTVASAISDVSGLEEDATQDVSLSGVFSDADGDTLTISAISSDETKATVSAASDGSKLTLTGVAEGTATITVTAQDSDDNRVSDAFDVAVTKAPELEEQTSSDIVARYDANGDGSIDVSEYTQAVRDYVAKRITYEEFMEVYKAYTGSG